MNKTDQLNSIKGHTSRRQLPILAVHAFTMAVLVIALVVFAGFIVKNQEEMLYQEKIQVGMIGLGHFVNTAVMPLLDDDPLSLNVLMKEARAIEGVLYVAVVDNGGHIKAHTDIRKVGSVFGKIEKGEQHVREDGTVMVKYQLPDGTQVLDLSRPVSFMQNQIGAVHVGLSLVFINAAIKKEMSGLIGNIIILGIVLFVIMLVSAMFLIFRVKGQRRDYDRLYANGETSSSTCQAGEESGGETGTDTRSLSMAEMNRNHVTVLFAGIKGFTAYAEINDHQKLMDDLNDYLSLATECISTYGGHIDKFVGDSVIAVFDNNPHETNHAERAVKAAVAMQKALQESGKSGNKLLLKVGIGINSGVVLSGLIGSSEQNEHVFIGESIKVAYSLNFMAGPGEIVMTHDAYRMVEHLVTVEPMPPQVLMRRTQPWENFRLLKLK